MKPITEKITWLVLFSIAMGFMESAVVVYLREIYYPEGFRFPLTPIGPDIGLTELFREVATIIMLYGIAHLSAKTTSQKFAFFLICFATWDLFYYLFLWLLIDWPESLFTWDILFLIPVPWVGPVITPCIISLTMIVLASIIIYFQQMEYSTKLKPKEWIILTAGSLIIILSFIWDYLRFVYNIEHSEMTGTISERRILFDEITGYVPMDFNWWIFIAGEAIILWGIVTFYLRMKKYGNTVVLANNQKNSPA